jgi:hypothetical protein
MNNLASGDSVIVDDEEYHSSKKDKLTTRGAEALKRYLNAFHHNAHCNMTMFDGSCIDEIEDFAEKILTEMEATAKAYKEGTEESVAKAVKEELAADNQVVLNFMETDCGSEIFSPEAKEQLEKATEVFKNADVNITMQDQGRVLVSIGDYEIGGSLDLKQDHLDFIKNAQQQGLFNETASFNKWHQAGESHALLNSFVLFHHSEQETDSYVLALSLSLGVLVLLLIGCAVAKFQISKRKAAKVTAKDIAQNFATNAK